MRLPGVRVHHPAGVRPGAQPHLPEGLPRGGEEGDRVRTELQRGESGTGPGDLQTDIDERML